MEEDEEDAGAVGVGFVRFEEGEDFWDGGGRGVDSFEFAGMSSSIGVIAPDEVAGVSSRLSSSGRSTSTDGSTKGPSSARFRFLARTLG